MKAHVENNSKQGDQDIPPFYFPAPQVSGPGIVFFVKINGNIYPCFVQLKLQQLSKGLAYIYAAEIIHRDIKPSNVLFDKNMPACITDFGLSCFADHSNNRTVGPWDIRKKIKYDKFLEKTRLSKITKDFLLHLLVLDPRKRPQARFVHRHHFLQNISESSRLARASLIKSPEERLGIAMTKSIKKATTPAPSPVLPSKRVQQSLTRTARFFKKPRRIPVSVVRDIISIAKTRPVVGIALVGDGRIFGAVQIVDDSQPRVVKSASYK
ncbi:Receptor-interacting serine/threonine-protein kinase 3 [Mortierella sp. AD031]|nr:Receptor-interacting serine/threonine-protein kinase 3 [Mortierella sp. AD031]